MPNFASVPRTIHNLTVPFKGPNDILKFSFRNRKDSSMIPLLLFPSSVYDYMKRGNSDGNGDIGNKMLYQHSISNGAKTGESIDFDHILLNIPGVQIREYLPDSRLDQIFNMVSTLMDSFKDTEKKDSNGSNSDGGDSKLKKANELGFIERVVEAGKFIIGFLTGNTTPNLISSFCKDSMGRWSKFGVKTVQDITDRVYAFPYELYYCLQSSANTAVYEIPYLNPVNVLKSEGGKGFAPDRIAFDGVGDKIPLPDFLKKALKAVFGNFLINYVQWWDAKAGTETSDSTVEIEFDLFNDSIDAACNNFLFVHTLIPHNRWTQYGMLAHNPTLYDIKIDGLHRLFMCGGQFEVTQKGVLRNIPKSFIETNSKMLSYINTLILEKDSFKNRIISDNLIKIPDVYHVKMQFSSLLPANLNTYLYSYAANDNIITRTDLDQSNDSTVLENMASVVGEFAKGVTKILIGGLKVTDNTADEKNTGNSNTVPDSTTTAGGEGTGKNTTPATTNPNNSSVLKALTVK